VWTARIIRNHTTEGAVFFCGRVDRKEKGLRLEELVQGRKNDAGLDPNPFSVAVKLQYPVHISGEIQNNPFS
jgi:hypothetical protein